MEGEETSEQVDGKHKVPHLIPWITSPSDDSGYSSDVFATPELSREGLRHLSSALVPCLTPDITRRSGGRLTSTPHSSYNQEKFCPPIAKLEVLDVSQESQFAITTSANIEVCELEVACIGTSNLLSILPPSNKKSIIEPTKPPVKNNADTQCVIPAQECTSQTIKDPLQMQKRLSPVKEHITSLKSYARKPQSLPGKEHTKIPAETQVATLSRVITRQRTSQWVFVRMLGEAEYLAMWVLKYLSGSDLLHLSHVNRQLRAIIHTDKELNRRKTSYIARQREERNRVGKENCRKEKCENEDKRTRSLATLSPHKQLSAIHNLTPSSPKKAPPALGVTSSQSQRFIEESCKLPKDQQLQKCMKCRAPAKIQKGQQRVTCSCGYDYCTRCFLPYHLRPQECPVLRPRTRGGGRRGGIFSTNCKKSLRRWCHGCVALDVRQPTEKIKSCKL